MKDMTRPYDQLSRFQMPPDIGVSERPRRDGEQTDRNDEDKHMAGLKKLVHEAGMILVFDCQARASTMASMGRYMKSTVQRPTSA